MSKITLNETGIQAPAMLTRDYRATYRWNKDGLTYRQLDSPSGRNWVVEGTAPAPIPPTPDLTVPMGNSLYVSSEGTTIADGAIRESIKPHFNSIDEAVATAVAGDTVYIMGGTHTVTSNIAKAGVIIHGLGKPILTFTGFPTMFGDNGVQTDLVIRGNIDFTTPFSSRKIIDFSHPSSTVLVEGNSVTGVGSDVIIVRCKANITLTGDLTHSGNDRIFAAYNGAEGELSFRNYISTLGSTSNSQHSLVGGSLSKRFTINCKNLDKTVNSAAPFRAEGTFGPDGAFIVNFESMDVDNGTTAGKDCIMFNSGFNEGYAELNCTGLAKTNRSVVAHWFNQNSTVKVTGKYLMQNNLAGTSFAYGNNYLATDSTIIEDAEITNAGPALNMMTATVGFDLKLNNVDMYQNYAGVGTTTCLQVAAAPNAPILNNVKMILDPGSTLQECIGTGNVRISQAGAGSNVPPNGTTNVIYGVLTDNPAYE